ncbi:hypothetical protein BDP27DRAFT_1361329 [Rhodocollybia butyracea]|uniref:Uncharacterized protein n=1 Tax=Rhodocollybia butyracea TaxID=206335 RepID=A0A9P5PZU9_9AGAR|nr:hypothetical protein BDP27DRAFT_1361329 [Rhodocollybia butyracea]
MKQLTNVFFTHDPGRFQEYLLDVESGKKTISGATLLLHEIVGQIMECDVDIRKGTGTGKSKYPKVQEMKKQRAETQIRVFEAQCKSLVERVKEAGKLEGSLAICDVSGSMGSLYSYRNNRTFKTQMGDPSAVEWKTNHDEIVDAYAKAGYEMGILGMGRRRVQEREGVTIMNGFSLGMLKVFLGEEEEDGDGDWEKVGEKTNIEIKDEEFTPLNVTKRAVMWRSFDGLVVID